MKMLRFHLVLKIAFQKDLPKSFKTFVTHPLKAIQCTQKAITTNSIANVLVTVKLLAVYMSKENLSTGLAMENWCARVQIPQQFPVV